ncbi:DNA-binding protein [Candidatus Korobacter versatilis]|uniref:DNA-binding protein n=1 Tax=Candidatus Korobacter versatilis TaxID=658062 RepID=UPI0002F06948|nr:DNA-binding protein [Candidatus Koribacter versatilis]
MEHVTTVGRVLCLHAAAKRLNVPERTLRFRASRGRIPGAFKQGKLWKFALNALVPRTPQFSQAVGGQ